MTATYEAGTLFDPAELVHPDYAPTLSIAERFELFHAANPWLIRRLETMTAERVARGRRRISMKFLFEVLRDELEDASTEGSYSINNSFSASYARLVMARNPQWDGVFQLRELRSAA